MLSEYAKNEMLKNYPYFTVEDVEVFEHPTRSKVVRMWNRWRDAGYEKGYHVAINDMKSICKCKGEEDDL